ncbi:MAG: antibiotic biosynthesis monooxygenase [Oscillospiraceae bacterium]|nr:antibiotic biosynthesis monooxygenase [Oscillospiraceae bacterium]
MNYTIYVIFDCFEGKREAFVEKVKAEGLVDAIRAEDGCVRYDFYFSEKDKNQILLIEEWESKEKQQIHVNQPHMAIFREIKKDYIGNTTLGEFEIK